MLRLDSVSPEDVREDSRTSSSKPRLAFFPHFLSSPCRGIPTRPQNGARHIPLAFILRWMVASGGWRGRSCQHGDTSSLPFDFCYRSYFITQNTFSLLSSLVFLFYYVMFIFYGDYYSRVGHATKFVFDRTLSPISILIIIINRQKTQVLGFSWGIPSVIYQNY